MGSFLVEDLDLMRVGRVRHRRMCRVGVISGSTLSMVGPSSLTWWYGFYLLLRLEL